MTSAPLSTSDDCALSRHTLWCKQTFQQCFSDRDCVLFPLQQQLFDFLDSKSGTGEGWLPFSIEFPSELEVSERLSVHTRADNTTPLFSSPAASHDPTERSGEKRRRRDSFSLLYGTASLSTQTRMFLATTFTGLHRIVSLIEPLQRHLYEIIRERSACHLYFDVEREVDCVGTCDEVTISSTSSSDEDVTDDVRHEPERVVTADLAHGIGHAARKSFRMPQSQYDTLVRRAVAVPADHCRLDCAHRPDNHQVDATLLRELRQFVKDAYPEIAPACADGDDARNDLFEEIIVMRSSPATSSSAFTRTGRAQARTGSCTPSQKFSQHYLIKMRDYCFDNAAAVGSFVMGFVDHLQARATESEEVHRRLFFHGPPVALSVLPQVEETYGSSALPFLPRRCVIDTAVYSRNRMMRCLGSCKLHKSAVLKLEKHWRDGVAMSFAQDEDAQTLSFIARSLISLPSQAFTSRRRVPVVVAEKKPKTAAQVGSSSLTIASAEIQEPARQALVSELAAAYERICGRPCSIGPTKQWSAQHLIMPIIGTRFCQHVQREHRSNNVYFVVDMEAKTAAQKCFDPDCAHFRSPLIALTSLHHLGGSPTPPPRPTDPLPDGDRSVT